MKKIVIMPGGFHPFHAGHLALYNAAREAFPSADVFVAATADTSTRPFPFKMKKMLAQTAGVPGNRFIQVKSPFRAEEITQMYDPNETQLIFVRSEKDRDTQPRPGGVKKDGSLSYLQPYKRKGLVPFSQHAYIAYLPVATFGPGMTSATEIRAKWAEMNDDQKIKLVQALYPGTVAKPGAAGKVSAMFDQIIGSNVDEQLTVNRSIGTVDTNTEITTTSGGNETVRTAQPIVPKLPSPQEQALLKQKEERIALLKSQGKSGSAVIRDPEVMRINREITNINAPSVQEAWLVNNPDSGHQIVPNGGMGSWNEETLVSNLARKFAGMVDMLKSRNYSGLNRVLYNDDVVRNMVNALAEYDRFISKQGRKPIAKGREIDLSTIDEDYIEECNKTKNIPQ